MVSTREASAPRGGHPRRRLAPRGRPRPCRLVTSLTLLVKTICVFFTSCTGLIVTSEGTSSVGHCNRSTDLKANDLPQTSTVLSPNEPTISIPDDHRLGSGAGVTVPCSPLLGHARGTVLGRQPRTFVYDHIDDRHRSDPVLLRDLRDFWPDRLHVSSLSTARFPLVGNPYQVLPQVDNCSRGNVRIPVPFVPNHQIAPGVLHSSCLVGALGAIGSFFCFMAFHTYIQKRRHFASRTTWRPPSVDRTPVVQQSAHGHIIEPCFMILTEVDNPSTTTRGRTLRRTGESLSGEPSKARMDSATVPGHDPSQTISHTADSSRNQTVLLCTRPTKRQCSADGPVMVIPRGQVVLDAHGLEDQAAERRTCAVDNARKTRSAKHLMF